MILLFLYLFMIDISSFRQLMHFIQDTVDIRIYPIHNGQTSLLNQILAFISRDMLFVNISLLFQLHPLVTQRFYHLLIVRSPNDIRFKHMHQRFFITVQPMQRNQCRFSFLRNFQLKTPFSEQLVDALLN